MNLCFYCTTGRDFKTFDYKVIHAFEFKNYFVKVIEIKNVIDLYDFSNKIKLDLLITDTRNVICYNRKVENYSTEFIEIFLNKYPYAIEIYDDYRE